jgi:hypothetical protein
LAVLAVHADGVSRAFLIAVVASAGFPVNRDLRRCLVGIFSIVIVPFLVIPGCLGLFFFGVDELINASTVFTCVAVVPDPPIVLAIGAASRRLLVVILIRIIGGPRRRC